MKYLNTAFLALALLIGLASSAAAQPVSGGVITVRDSSSGAVVPNIGDDTNDALRVSIVASSVASGGTSSNFTSAFPASGTAAGFSDGTNMQGARVVDADTGGGTVYTLLGNLVRRASGGPVELIGQATMANSLPVVLASDQSAIPVTQSGTWTVQPGNTANTTAWLVKELRAATPTTSNVAASATNVTCLASNANRLGATLFNDSTVHVFAKFGATATSSSFTYKVEGGGTLEVPFGYTGIIDCIWASATGNARVTELAQ